ncbi:hypothetical protein COT83_01445 [Candidatus Peregrinibacteria bacterium CG10_big_fil_rev_8_21_14_0_10_44_7]|nr:MAG: hypothetical protein COT83_01445 [Candidatus Peregrinibacteria bacterium CG10_big_fil_rev_8_21_14_0_10_44_7]PIX80453.1 MAG: hypothetical protein COZ35_00690 [Candidatus Peregrinibacteria bacterium CG_4_10_14_3_um_filter_44_21]PJB89362.1 MAG: hypothetical protein CO082_01275 [Candidatus Peregrinibacteria bacterium CG_4_9_14_0_8_um_filter_44_15]
MKKQIWFVILVSFIGISLVLWFIVIAFSGFGPGTLDYDGYFVDGFGLSRNSSIDVTLYSDYGLSVPTKVIAVGWNDLYIIVEREVLVQNSSAGEILWYVIDRVNLSISDPFDEGEFSRVKDELGLSDVEMMKSGDLSSSLF